MDHPERRVVVLYSLVLLLALRSAKSASFQSSETGVEPPELNEVLLDDQLGWEGISEEDHAEEEKRAFHAMRGKKEDELGWDDADKRAFHAMRGKRLLAPASVDSFIAQLRRAVLQGKRGSGFFGMRGKRQPRTSGKSPQRSAFVATRGRRSVHADPSTNQQF